MKNGIESPVWPCGPLVWQRRMPQSRTGIINPRNSSLNPAPTKPMYVHVFPPSYTMRFSLSIQTNISPVLVQYLGSMLIKDLRGTESTQDACAKMRVCHKFLLRSRGADAVIMHKDWVNGKSPKCPFCLCSVCSSRGRRNRWEKSRPSSSRSPTRAWSSSTQPIRLATTCTHCF